MTKRTIPPGKTVPDSGIYTDTSSGHRATLVRGKTAPPTEHAGGKWQQKIDTNPNDRTSK